MRCFAIDTPCHISNKSNQIEDPIRVGVDGRTKQMWEHRNAYGMMVRKLEEKNSMEYLDVDEKIIIK
jgi:hypothetical protein